MMDVVEVEMSPDEAREKLRDYRAAKHRDAESEYGAAKKLLEVLARDRTVVNVADAIAFAGFDDDGRPSLAIARADRKQVRVSKSFRHSRSMIFDCRSNNRHSDTLVVEINRSTLAGQLVPTGYATVPMVPPDVRPPTGQLREWHILFEVEQWHDQPIVDPPYDPWLLRHIEGEFYEVLAKWDLTEVERAAMQMAALRGQGT
ncbi:MAG: hypothetical protein AAGJ83_13925 [Planctomycetota bacterium]